MKTIEKRGAHSASGPISDMLKLIPRGAKVIAAAGSRSLGQVTCEMAYLLKGEIFHLSISQKGGLS